MSKQTDCRPPKPGHRAESPTGKPGDPPKGQLPSAGPKRTHRTQSHSASQNPHQHLPSWLAMLPFTPSGGLRTKQQQAASNKQQATSSKQGTTAHRQQQEQPTSSSSSPQAAAAALKQQQQQHKQQQSRAVVFAWVGGGLKPKKLGRKEEVSPPQPPHQSTANQAHMATDSTAHTKGQILPAPEGPQGLIWA